jgi:hypothetical protein
MIVRSSAVTCMQTSRQRAGNRLLHHSPMHAQLPGHSRNRPHAELVLSVICSNSSTLALQSNESPPLGLSPNQSSRSVMEWAKIYCRTEPVQNTEIKSFSKTWFADR